MTAAQTSVLVAEDEPDTLRGLERALRREGYRVEAARDGLEGAEKLKGEKFDVVVADLRMPVVDGMDLLHIAKQRDGDVVFIMITAYGTTENAVEAMKLGSSDYIAKPFATSDLVAAIEKGLHEKWRGRPSGGPAGVETGTIYRAPAEHAWASPQPDGTVLIGADEEFFREAGEVVFCDLPLQGDRIVRGQRCARTINTTGLIQKPFHSPLSGTVVALSEKMEHEPWEYGRDPYGEGWLFKIVPSNLEEEIGLLTPQGETVRNDV